MCFYHKSEKIHCPIDGNTPLEMQIRISHLIILYLIAVTVAIYGQTVNHSFISFDDNLYVTENSHVMGGLSKKNICWAFTLDDKENTYWHPITWISHMLDCELFGVNSGAHHLTNLFLHIANALLLFHIFRLMTGASLQSAFLAILFAIHPINVESVAWVSERKNLLSTFFGLFTIWAYFTYTQKPNLKHYCFVFILFCMSLLAKPMLVTLPFILLLIDYWPLKRICFSRTRQNSFIRKVLSLILEKIPLIITSLGLSWIVYSSLERYEVIASTQLIPLDVRFFNAVVSYISYLLKLFWPFNLSFYYPFPSSVSVWMWVSALLLLLGFTILIIKPVRKPEYIVGWFWFIGTLIPVCGIVQGGLWPAMADRWAYIPSIGIFLMIAWSIPDIELKNNYKQIRVIAIYAVVTTIITFLQGISWIQTGYWANSLSLYSHALEITKDNPVVLTNLGNSLKEKGMMGDAVAYYQKAIKKDPYFHDAFFNLGNAYRDMGLEIKALQSYYNALKISSNSIKAHVNLGILLINHKQFQKAIHHFRTAANLSPDTAIVQNNLGMALFLGGFKEEAIEHIKLALKLDPEYKQAKKNLERIQLAD